jgi:hypothetical protein
MAVWLILHRVMPLDWMVSVHDRNRTLTVWMILLMVCRLVSLFVTWVEFKFIIVMQTGMGVRFVPTVDALLMLIRRRIPVVYKGRRRLGYW